jgi:hypothetical protein
MTFKHAEAVKDRHEAELLSLDGVEGVGLGEKQGAPAIKVYVYSMPLATANLPHVLEDVPVVVEESGAFEAY